MSSRTQGVPSLKSLSLAAFASASLLAALPACAAITDVGTVSGGLISGGTAVNASGTVAGTSQEAGGHFVPFAKTAGGSITVLQPVAAGEPCRVSDLNSSNRIAGNCESSTGDKYAVLWSSPSAAPSVLQPLALSGEESSAAEMNQTGSVVGTSTDTGDKKHAVIWLAGSTTATELPMPSLLGLSDQECVATALNNATSPGPAAAGTCTMTNGDNVAVLWTPTGLLGAYVPTVLNAPASGDNCTAQDINVSGQVAGNCEVNDGGMIDIAAVSWSAGSTTPTVLSNPAGTDFEAVALSDAGGIACKFVNNGFSHACFWNPSAGTFIDVGTLGGNNSSVSGINGSNTIVGTSETTTGVNTTHAFTWTAGGGMVDLGTLGGASSSGLDISSSGKVMGVSQISDGHFHAFVGP